MVLRSEKSIESYLNHVNDLEMIWKYGWKIPLHSRKTDILFDVRGYTYLVPEVCFKNNAV